MKKILLMMCVAIIAVSSCSKPKPTIEPPVVNKITVLPVSSDVDADFTGTKEFVVTSEEAWTLSGLPEDGWLVADVKAGDGNGKVILTFKANTSPVARNAKLVFMDSNKKTTEVAVKQNGIKIDKPDPSKITMIAIEGGPFVMGNPDNDGVSSAHDVELSSFRMSVYEVTQKIYSDITGGNPSVNVKGDNYPVTDQTWEKAIAFCNALSIKEGLTPAYSGTALAKGTNGYRIPTEAQFEYAAIGGKKTQGYWFPGSDEMSDVCVHAISEENGKVVSGALAEVGTKSPNELGIYDLGGNCWEWCWDYYEEKFIVPAPKDPLGPESGEDRVIRGGAFDTFFYSCSIYGRFGTNEGWDDTSFRVVLPAEGATW